MATRFNYDDEDFGDENLFPDSESEADFIKRQDAFNQMQIDVARTELNQRLLRQVIKMCESQTGWASRSHKARLNMIIESYSVFSSLIGNPEGEVN